MTIARTISVNWKADTSGFESGLIRMEKTSKRAEKSIFQVAKESGKLASVAGAAFSSMSAGIGIATASAESLNGAMISAGAAMAASFAAGGPIGLAIAGVSALVGWFSRTDEEAEKAAKTIREKFTKAVEDQHKALEKIRREREDLTALKRARALGIPDDIALADIKRGREVQEARASQASARKDFEDLLTDYDKRLIERFGMDTFRRSLDEEQSDRSKAGGLEPIRDAMKALQAATQVLSETLKVQESRIKLGLDPERAGPFVPEPVTPRGTIEYVAGALQKMQATDDAMQRHNAAMEAYTQELVRQGRAPARTSR